MLCMAIGHLSLREFEDEDNDDIYDDNDDDNVDNDDNVVYGHRPSVPQRVYEELSVDCRIWRAALLLGQKHKHCCWEKKHKEDKTQTRLTKLQIKTSNIVCKAKTSNQCFF